MITMLQDENQEIRRAAVNALSEIHDTRAIKPLVALLQDEERYMRHVAVDALRAMHWQPENDTQRAWFGIVGRGGPISRNLYLGPAVIEPLLLIIKDSYEDYSKRVDAVEVLGEIGDTRAVRPLVKLADESNYAERALQSLRRVLERVQADIALEDLRAVAALNNKVQVVSHTEHESCETSLIAVDCSQVRQLAGQGLIRRGLAA